LASTPSGNTGGGLGVGDVNGDGLTDVLSGSTLYFGPAGQAASATVSLPTGTNLQPVGDVNGDGIDDLMGICTLSTCSSAGGIRYGHSGTGGPSANYDTSYPWGVGSSPPNIAAVGDINGDGNADVLILHSAGGSGQVVDLAYGSSSGLQQALGATHLYFMVGCSLGLSQMACLDEAASPLRHRQD
jgi:hypothetical protein